MRIGVDVMGGDHAPHPILEGALSAIEHLHDEDVIVLFGDQKIIEQGVADSGVDTSRVEIVSTTQEISMDESPVDAVDKNKTVRSYNFVKREVKKQSIQSTQ